jgi:hypothetical protein
VKGTIILCLQQMVVHKHGQKRWRESLRRAGLVESRDFGVLEYVPDRDVLRIMESVSDVACISMEEVMEAFGEYWSTTYAPEVYKAYYSHVKSARELLLHLDEIHTATTKAMKSARPPHFRYEWKGDKLLIMHYESPRGLVVLMPGLVRGVGKYFHEKLTVTLVGNAVHVQFP